jgi:leucyl aminopeptidase
MSDDFVESYQASLPIQRTRSGEKMEIQIELSGYQGVECDALAVIIFEGEKPEQGFLRDLNERTDAVISEVIAGGEIRGKQGDVVYIHHAGRIAARRLALIGGGNIKNFGPDAMAKCAGTAARFLRTKGAHTFAFMLRPELALKSGAQAAVEGVLVGLYEPDTYKTREKEERQIDRLILIADSGSENELEAGIKDGQVMGDAVNLARELANEPSSDLTPSELAARAEKKAKEVGLEIDVLDEARISELGMGAFLGVSRGSEEPPKLVVLTYTPKDPANQEVIAVVGKGITFDSGGISIKPADGMDRMKYDMSGAADTLGIMYALAHRKPRVKVIGLMPTCENMPSGRAYKPGDVLHAMNGKTIEIVNTDAEGRLILADAISYARKLGATRIIDMATLTGACQVALGMVNTGLLANDQKFADDIRESGREVGEKLWQLPMDVEYRELIRSDIADMKNSGGRYGGAITAAFLLNEFAEDTPWVHLDIAGTAWDSDRKPYMAKGPTGACVRTIVNYICNHV